MLGGGGRLGMLFFCELYVIRDELALLGRTAHHPRSWASTSYNYNRSWASTSYKYNYQLPATSQLPAARSVQRRAFAFAYRLSATANALRNSKLSSFHAQMSGRELRGFQERQQLHRQL